MNTAGLVAWTAEHGSAVVTKKDITCAISSKLVRMLWEGVPTMALGSEVAGKARIDLVLDALAWQRTRYPGASELRLVVGVDAELSESKVLREHLGAIGTIATAIAGGPQIRLFVLDGGEPREMPLKPAEFTTGKPGEWAQLLEIAAHSTPPDAALELAGLVGHPSFGVYPKLSNKGKVWQLRLDGVEVGRLGAAGNTLALNTSNIDGMGEPRDTWKQVVGASTRPIDTGDLPSAAATLLALIDRWQSIADGPLRHGHPEHALEAWILSGRLVLVADGNALAPAAVAGPVLRSAQFPTLWGDITSPARYLDALLRDGQGRPWAVELKDQFAGGGNGAYLRDGIAQAILYRHYIRSCIELNPFFDSLGLSRVDCQAALAFPAHAPGADAIVASHHEIAAMCDVHVIEFPYPGGHESH